MNVLHGDNVVEVVSYFNHILLATDKIDFHIF